MTEETVKKSITLAAATATILFCLAPFGYMILTGFSRQADFFAPSTPWIPTLANYRAVLVSESLHFAAFMRNSLIVSAVSAGINTITGKAAFVTCTRQDF